MAVAQAQVPTRTRKSTTPPVSKDALFIVSMTPESLVDGVETEVELVVAYELKSAPEALIEVAANNLKAQSFTPFTSQRVTQGNGMATVRGKLTPRYWTANVVPRITAFIVIPGAEVTSRKVVASDTKAVIVALRPNPPETYAVNPNPSVVHEDGVRIKSLRPQSFVEGQEVDVEVTVTYDLQSREVAELTLGFSRGRASAYFPVTKLQVQRGQGEVVLRGRVTPQRTGSLPFAKLHINLSEFPRRERSVALATDSETVEVR